jgi:hypothetical protein
MFRVLVSSSHVSETMDCIELFRVFLILQHSSNSTFILIVHSFQAHVCCSIVSKASKLLLVVGLCIFHFELLRLMGTGCTEHPATNTDKCMYKMILYEMQ